MRIVELRTENIKNLKVVEIKPDGSVVLTGANGAGKSAILDSIMMTLTGKKVDKPIRDGEKRAEVVVDLGEYKVKKVWTDKGERLEVMNKDKAKYESPQTFLNQILGDLSFDPLAFKDMKDKAQRELLLKVLGLDFVENDAKKKGLYEERTLKNREVKSIEARVASIGKPEEGLPDKEVLVSEELKKLQVLQNKQIEHLKFEDTQKSINDESIRMGTEILNLKGEINKIQEQIRVYEQRVMSNKEKLSNAKEPDNATNEDIEKARIVVEEADSKNIEIREKLNYNDMKTQLSDAVKESEKITATMEKLDEEKIQKIKACKFPVAGLTVDEDMVLFEGIPFSQISTGQQVRVSTAIAMSLNPRLKIILVRDGSLLDKAGLKEIADMAKKEDYQIWLERCDETEKMGIFIEAGEVKTINE